MISLTKRKTMKKHDSEYCGRGEKIYLLVRHTMIGEYKVRQALSACCVGKVREMVGPLDADDEIYLKCNMQGLK